MAAKTFHKQLAAHLSRLRLTTFDQLAGHLLDTHYTQERYAGLARRDRKKDARSDVADAIRRAKSTGRLIEKNGRAARPLAQHFSSTANVTKRFWTSTFKSSSNRGLPVRVAT